MQRRPDAPPTYITQELQRVIRPGLFTKVSEDVRFEPEPTIDEEEYKHILDVMGGMALMMERSPRTFTKLKEEEIRDHFLLQLNGHYKGNALGETFNRKGKTDILVREQDKNLFIGECKIWEDANGITAAIDQLLSYLTWRDTKAALVVFVKGKSIDRPLATIMKTTEKHECMKRFEEKSAGRQRFVFGKRERSPSREIILAVLVFHIPPLEGVADISWMRHSARDRLRPVVPSGKPSQHALLKGDPMRESATLAEIAVDGSRQVGDGTTL